MTDTTPPPAKKPAAAKKPAPVKTSPAKSSAKAPAAAKPATTTASAATPLAPPAPPAPPVIESSPALPAPPVTPASSGAPASAPMPAPMLESEARMWSMLMHILAAVALVMSAGTLAFLVPLVIWLINRDRSALIDHHGKQNLNLQLTTMLVMFLGVIIGFATFLVGFIVTGPIMFFYGLYALIISIVAGVRAHEGVYYRIPVVIPFVR